MDIVITLELLQWKKSTVMESLDIVLDFNIKTVLAVFVTSGVNQFLWDFNKSALYDVYILGQ